MLCFGLFLFVFAAFAVHRRSDSSPSQWPTFLTGDPPTLVFTRADLQRIWKWEIESGHYPSGQKSASCFVTLSEVDPWLIQVYLAPFFSFFPPFLRAFWFYSSRSDRFLISNPKPSPSTAESGQTAT